MMLPSRSAANVARTKTKEGKKTIEKLLHLVRAEIWDVI